MDCRRPASADFWEFATQWMYNYNHYRPHIALGGFTPKLM
jgi:transposase InsO family protein